MKSDAQQRSLTPDARNDRLGGLALAALGGAFLVARPVANQLTPYSPEAGFAGLLALLFVCVASLRAASAKPVCAAPENLVLAAAMWIGLFLWGAIRSPYPGASVPLASDAILYVLMLVAGYFTGRMEPRLRGAFIRAIIAMAAVEAFAGLWQVFVDLPHLRSQIKAGLEIMPDELNSKIGLDRLNGDDAYVTFGNPNSLASYLLVGFFLLLGHAWDPFRARFERGSSAPEKWLIAANVLLGALMLATLFWTGSKGGGVALLLGLWFFALQRLNTRFPILNTLTALGVAALVVLLALGLAGIVPSRFYGLSMQVRFEYWKSALAMFARHPLDGVGVGGYGEWFLMFKTPMGWESRDPHNEYVSLLAELGVLGPLVYLLIWKLVLKHSRCGAGIPPASDPVQAASLLHNSPHDLERVTPPPHGCTRDALFDLFIRSFTTLGRTHPIDIRRADPSDFLRTDVRGVAQGRAAVRGKRRTSGGTLHRAAARLCARRVYAVLMHQLVDFDFKAQAVMTALFLCGGLFWGEADARMPAREKNPFLSKRAGSLALIFAVLLIPTAFWIPFRSGLARREALDLQAYLDQVKAHPEEAGAELSSNAARAGSLDALARAADAAPFDAEPLLQEALARARLERHLPFSEGEKKILDLLQQSAALRPLSAPPHVLIACVYFQRGLAPNASDPRANFERARAEFAEAHRLYPLHPGLLFMEGDTLLMMGEAKRACDDYWEAYALDMRINDPNVYLSAIFADPRPGIFARHGSDANVLNTIDALTAASGRAGGELKQNPRAYMGLLARRAGALANLANEFKKGRSTSTALAIALMESELLGTTAEMTRVPLDISAHAHAALLHVLSVKRSLPPTASPESIAARLRELRDAARKLQDESIRAGQPGTAPWIFDQLIGAK